MDKSLQADKGKITIRNKINDTNFWLLLIYSLLPGIYKILDNQMIMVFCMPIIFYLIYLIYNKIVLTRFDILFVFFAFYIVFQSLFWPLIPIVNKTAIAMGLFMNVLPMVGYVWAKGIDFDHFAKILLRIITVHCIIGIILYPPFGITSSLIPIVDILVREVAAGRMASVSGSLGFGNLLMVGFALSFFVDKRFLPLMFICLIFSAQRSAWLSGFFVLLFYIWSTLKEGSIFRMLIAVTISIILAIGLFYFIENFLDFDLSFIISRFHDIDEAGSERTDLWKAGIENFLQYPLGTGLGQVGQMASRYEDAKSSFQVVPDGDYFRVLSESGIIGGIFYFFTLTIYCFTLVFSKFNTKYEHAIVALMGGSLIQMIGSNVSEFYFTNFIYWTIFGYYYLIISRKLNFRIINKI